MSRAPAPEFSFIVRPSAIVGEGAPGEFAHEASPDQCAALAVRFGFLALDYFRISARLVPVRGGPDFRLYGHIAARVVQSCVVTLDPVITEVDRDFDLLLHANQQDDDPIAETEEDFELYAGDAIDIAEICAVELVLGLDPYPRTPGISLDAPGPGGQGSDEAGESEGKGSPATTGNRPFEKLAALKRRT